MDRCLRESSPFEQINTFSKISSKSFLLKKNVALRTGSFKCLQLFFFFLFYLLFYCNNKSCKFPPLPLFLWVQAVKVHCICLVCYFLINNQFYKLHLPLQNFCFSLFFGLLIFIFSCLNCLY